MRFELMSSRGIVRGHASEPYRDNEDELLDLLQNIQLIDAPWIDRVQVAQSCLQDTTSAMVRGYAALALIDLEWRDAALDIIEVLRRPGIAEQSGTLLFALNEIGAHLPLEIAAITARDGSYEAQNEVMTAIEANRIASFDDEAEDRVLATVTPLLGSDETPAAELAERLLAYIADQKSQSLKP